MNRASIIVVVLGLVMACGRVEPRAPGGSAQAATAGGSVAVTRTIGWWAYQDSLTVTGLDVEVVGSQLGLFKGDAVIRLHVRGSLLATQPGWRPHVGQAHISQRFVRAPKGELEGEIEITPVVEVSQEPGYAGEPQPLDLRVDEVVSTYRWGANRYVIRCGAIERELEIFRAK